MNIAALCIKCGEPKSAPLAPCPACRFVPETPQDQTASEFCSLMHQAREKLVELQQEIFNGEKIEIPTLATPPRLEPTRPAAPPSPQNRVLSESAREATHTELFAKFTRRAETFWMGAWIALPVALIAAAFTFAGVIRGENYRTGYSDPSSLRMLDAIAKLPFGETLIIWGPGQSEHGFNLLYLLPFLGAMALPFWLGFQSHKAEKKALQHKVEGKAEPDFAGADRSHF